MNTSNAAQYINDTCTNLQRYSGKTVLVAVSGGVDSSTSAALIKKAGLQCRLITIDTGFVRNDDVRFVKKIFKDVAVIKAGDIFCKALKSQVSATEKRKKFRNIYFNLIKNFAAEHSISYIVQGTQFPKPAVRNYHNLATKEFLATRIKVIEPVKGLTKDQIRVVAKKLGLPKVVVERRPFPGPGLLIRFSGEYTKERLSLIKKLTFLIDTFVAQNSKVFKDCYQIFPYLTSEYVLFVKRNNSYGTAPVVLIRAVKVHTIKNSLVYKPFHVPLDLREKLVSQIMDLGTVGRVCFDETTKYGIGMNVKGGGTIEYA